MQVPEQKNPIQREIIILLVILAILGCLLVLLIGGGYIYYQNYTETQSLSGTATSAFMATKIKRDTEAQAKSTAQASATAQALHAQSTATALAKNAELMNYKYYDPFLNNQAAWRAQEEDNQYWRGNVAIEVGTYNWQVTEVLEPFVGWSDFYTEETLTDFDAAVLARRQQGEPAEYCYGLLFRKSPEGFDAGSYIFTVCENGYFAIYYYDESAPWEEIQGWTETSLLYQEDWNLLEISARGSDFTLSINHQQVAAYNDDRLSEGLVAILIDVYEKNPGSIQFDNFALQPR